MLNKVRVGNVDGDVEQLLKAKFYVTLMKTSIQKLPCTCMHKTNQLLAEMKLFLIFYLLSLTPDDKIPDNFKYLLATILTAQNQNQTNTGGLAKLLKLKIGAKVMLTVNVDIQDRLTNGQTGNVKHIEFVHGSIHKVYVNFSDEESGVRAMISSYLGRQNC